MYFFFFNDTATTEIYTLTLHDALPISVDFLNPDEPVFGVTINGESRAYPHRIMGWHELANDRLGGELITFVF